MYDPVIDVGMNATAADGDSSRLDEETSEGKGRREKVIVSFLRQFSFWGCKNPKKDDANESACQGFVASPRTFSDQHAERRSNMAKRRNSMPLQNATLQPSAIPTSLSA